MADPADLCNCCEGDTQETPQEINNRPGLQTIAYRVGTHAQFKATLLARLHSAHQPALDDLRTRDDLDFTISLLDAFATVADVLTFYSERIANEAYLRTATERRSLLELGQLVGYQLRPGVAANALLAFTIDDAPGAFASALIPSTTAQVVPETPPTVTVGIGTKVSSVPGPGENSQTFETIEAIDAKAEWNAMQPRLTQPQQADTAAAQFILAGTISTIKKGDRLLVVTETGKQVLRQVLNVTISSSPSSADPASAITTIDVDTVADGSVGYLPASLALSNDLPNGSVGDFAAGTPLTAAVARSIIGKTWDADSLLALASIQGWSIAQLATDLNEQVAQQNQLAAGGLHVLRQRAAAFGHNAPSWLSLPATLRHATRFQVADSSNPPDVTWITVPAAYPTDWDNFTLADEAASLVAPTLDLDSTYPDIVAGSRAVIVGPDGKFAPVTVTSTQDVVRTRATQTAKITMLSISSPTPHLCMFPVRGTLILCQSEELSLAPVPVPDDVEGRFIELDRAYLGLRKGRTVLITAERSDLNGVTVTEARTLKNVTLIRGFSVLELDSSLNYTYRRSTVYICANVAQSTHGESVRSVLDPLALTAQRGSGLLGSGDGSQTFQTVALQFVPLTYVSADTPTGTSSTLSVRVDDVLWKEVPFLYGHGPDERIYALSQDDSGQTSVTFGDGVTGSRLPTGQHNINAAYRRGLGLAGLVNANQLSQLMTRPAGVKAVSNPLPAAGAADPEGIEEARANVTLTIRTLDRVVSLEDYQDFSRAFAGIEKSIATWTWSGQQRVVLLTVAGADGAIVPVGSTMYNNLRKALIDSGEPFVDLRLFGYDPIFFQLGGTVSVFPDQSIDAMAAAVETALRSAFSFDSRDFGQPVHVSEVIATIQGVAGVQDVVVTQLYRSDSGAAAPTDLPAAMPRPGKNEIFAAQLLTLDPRPLGLTVTQ